MTLFLQKRGHLTEVHDCRGQTWATIERDAPYYRVRLLGQPGSRMKKTATLKAAHRVAEDWYEQQ